MKAPLRTKSIGTKVSEEEFAVLEATARAADMTLSEWVRAVLLAAPGVEIPDDEAALAGRVTLADERTRAVTATALSSAATPGGCSVRSPPR
jgi:2-keto-4-pentenoate hydratase